MIELIGLLIYSCSSLLFRTIINNFRMFIKDFRINVEFYATRIRQIWYSS